MRKTKTLICVIVERMIWFITQRQIVKELHKLRWKRGIEKTNLAFKYYRHEVRGQGVRLDDFTSELFRREFFDNGILGFLKLIHKKIREGYFENFDYRLNDVIEQCIENGYIKKDDCSPPHLKETDAGEKLISLWYYPKQILKQPIIIKIIELGVVFAFGYITAKYLNTKL